ncbi:MAG: ribose 5-phosphate isomerase B [Anaerovoracaceae bacterium]|jgi:RpiB/LacA/LacB family sugar-phosphate isomerase
MKVVLASDHGGYMLKESIEGYLIGMGIQFEDLGPHEEDADDDYPDYGIKCAEMVTSGKADRGIVCCGSGIGMSIIANKVKGIRCALCTSTELAEMSRKHNDANMLALGGRYLETFDALQIVQKWLDTEFEGGRHQRRVDKITAYEENNGR